MPICHVVLVTYGEPPSPSFIDQLVYSWRILLGLTRTVARIPAAVIPLIALSRARGRRRLWQAHRYRSPLEPITRAQAEAVCRVLEGASGGDAWRVHVAYEFRDPLLGVVLDAIPAGEPVWVAPMYATDSAFTHALSRQTATAVAARRRMAITVLPALDSDCLTAISVEHVLGCLADDRVEPRSTALVLAAHGTLLAPERPIETGRESTERLCAAIRQRLTPHFGMVANGWLNHTRGGRWTEPSIEETLKRVRDAGFESVVYYPYGFLADNAESQLEGWVAAASQPELRVRFLPCLNGSPELTAAIAGQVLSTAP